MAEIGDRALVLFDGHCGFCNRSVRWFLRHDGLDRMRFAAFDSPAVADLLTRAGLDVSEAKGPRGSIVVVRSVGLPCADLLVRSRAVLLMLSLLPRPWPAVSWMLGLIPAPLRDLGYRLVARYRYRLGGRLQSCPIPTEAERSRFL